MAKPCNRTSAHCLSQIERVMHFLFVSLQVCETKYHKFVDSTGTGFKSEKWEVRLYKQWNKRNEERSKRARAPRSPLPLAPSPPKIAEAASGAASLLPSVPKVTCHPEAEGIVLKVRRGDIL